MRRRFVVICTAVLIFAAFSAAGAAIAATMDDAVPSPDSSAGSLQTVVASEGITGIALPSELPDLVDEKVRSSDFVYSFDPMRKATSSLPRQSSRRAAPTLAETPSNQSGSLTITAHVLPARIIVVNENEKVIAVSGNSEDAGAADTVYIVRRGNLSGESIRLTQSVWTDAGSFIAEFNERHQ